MIINLSFLILICLYCYLPYFVSSAKSNQDISSLDTILNDNNDDIFATNTATNTNITNVIISNKLTSIISNNSDNNNDDNIVQLQVHFEKKFNEPIILQSPIITTKTKVSDAIESVILSTSHTNNNRKKRNNTSTVITKVGKTITPATTIIPVTFNTAFNNNSIIPVIINRRITTPEEYAKIVLFKYYKNGQLTYIADGINEELLEQTGCNANDKFAFILHGWKENCDVEWVPLLISKLTQYRGGCIICIDYGFFAQEPYVRLVRQYEPLSNLITDKLRYLRNQGFNPDKAYMFGFSYGGQLACAVGRKLGTKLIKEIDTCDMAGPGFDYKVNRLDHRDAAQNVQCIHTTRDKGTKFYTCHQDWRMGNCGFSQPAAQEPPKGSHGLCPYFYINAFEYAFYAVNRPDKCISRKPAKFWPDGFKMGYMESRKNEVQGELFAYTGEQYPFNVAIDSDTSADITTDSLNNNNQNNNNLNNNYQNINIYDLQYPPRPQAFLFYGQNPQQIPNFRDRPVLNSIMRARKFLRRLQRNLRNQLI